MHSKPASECDLGKDQHVPGWHTHTVSMGLGLSCCTLDQGIRLYHDNTEVIQCEPKKFIAVAFLMLVLVYDAMDMALLIKHVHRDVAVNKNENGTLTLGILGYCLDLYNAEKSCIKSLGQLLSNHPTGIS